MQIGINYGRARLELDIPAERLVSVRGQVDGKALADPAAALRDALEAPHHFPPLRRALTPDDHVAIVVDEHLPRLPELLRTVLEHLQTAGVQPEAVTLLRATAESDNGHDNAWREQLGPVRVEVHDPSDRKHLSYLATTRQGRRIYLNRTAVDADQLIILSGRRYDPLLGYSGSEGALFPALSDEATQHEFAGRLSLAAPGAKPWAARAEATEVAWLLGAPFMIQVIEGAGDDILHVVAGLAETTAEGEQLLNARWRKTIDQPADTVLASLSGDPSRHDFTELARALACASRVVRPNGRIVLLTQANPDVAAVTALFRDAEEPERALQRLQKDQPPGMAAAFEWLSGVQSAHVYLLSGMPEETAEELFTTPLEQARQVQRLLDSDGSCLVLQDAHKTLAVTE